MTGTEAKEIREYFGFSLEELSAVLGYSQKQDIHRVEVMEIVPTRYKAAIQLLAQKCNSIKYFIHFYISTKEISNKDYQIVYHKGRVVKINIRREFVNELSNLLRSFLPFKEFVFDKLTGFSCIEFEYETKN